MERLCSPPGTRRWHIGPMNRTLTTALATAMIWGFLAATQPASAGEPDPSEYQKLLPPVTRTYTPDTTRADYQKLLEAFGSNKELPTGYELQTLIALSHFPELRDTRIRFVEKDAGIPIASRPRPISTFRRREKRLYLVVIDTTSAERGALLLKNQPFNAQVGIIGHELAHTAWYVNRSFFGIVSDSVCQLSQSCRAGFERATDRRLVLHGLGWQRYDHSAFVRAGFREEGIVSDGAGGAYMDPPELLAVMEESGLYGPPPLAADIPDR